MTAEMGGTLPPMHAELGGDLPPMHAELGGTLPPVRVGPDMPAKPDAQTTAKDALAKLTAKQKLGKRIAETGQEIAKATEPNQKAMAGPNTPAVPLIHTDNYAQFHQWMNNMIGMKPNGK